MKAMKKLAIILALILVFSFAVTSCSNGNTTSNETTGTQDETQVGTQAGTDASTDSEKPGDTDTEGSQSTSVPEDTESNTDKETQSETATETEKATETEEETEVITDVMIGATIEAEYASNFSVSRVFSNDMVVQRGEHIRVWGFAPESENGKKVSGEFKGMFAEAIVENGEWCITFGARLEADTNAAQMKIYTDKTEVIFNGVLVGDVYMIIGQSNVEAGAGSVADVDPDAPIRLNRTTSSSGGSFPEKGTDYVYKDLVNPKQWTKATANEISSFSAVGYHFAKAITEKTEEKIPVGIIEVGFSGAPIGSFLPNEVAEKYKTDKFSATTGKFVTTGVNANKYPGRGIYNCHIAPFEKYAMAGLIWYQGESNNSLDEAVKYNEIFAALMTYMRSTHNLVNKDFPVFIMEFPSIYKQPADFSGTWHFMELGIIRSYMGSIPTVLKNSYVSVSNDLWTDRTYYNSLHPNCKYEQAQRLSGLASSVIYNNETLDKVTGPIFKSAEISEDKKTVVITFTNVGEGLSTKDGSTAVKGLVGLLNKPMVHSPIAPVSATITAKDKLTVVFSDEVKAVAYNYYSEDLYGETINLCNSNGCPAAAFITPYGEKSLDNYTSDSFIDKSAGAAAFKKSAFDTLTADGENIFTVGKVSQELAAAGNKITVYKGTSNIGTQGWIGFGYEIIMFGYSIDGSNAIFNAYPTYASQAVINAGGQYAKRFNINIDISDLDVGTHTVTVLALINLKGGRAVNMLTFTVEVIEKPVAPEGLDLPMYNEGDYGFTKIAFDMLRLDGTDLYLGEYNTKLEAAGNKIKITKGTHTLRLYGWIGYETEIDKFGYSIDGGEPIIDTDPAATGASVLEAGGQYARRYDLSVDLSSLDVGLHTFEMLVRINTTDGTAVLKMISFTVVVE